MKNYEVTYHECYSKVYDVKATTAQEAEQIICEDILEGRRSGPDQCYNSFCITECLEEDVSIVKYNKEAEEFVKANRLFIYPESWGDSAGLYAVMPIQYDDQDCYIMLDSNDCFGIYKNCAKEAFMNEDMLLTGNINDNVDDEIRIYLNMLQVLRDAWK